MTPGDGLALTGNRVRVGCDVAAVSEVADAVNRFGDRYLRRVYTADELRDCAGPERIRRLAARFAAKEAVIKAFATPEMAFPLTSIEVVKRNGTPQVLLHGSVARAARELGWQEVSLSLSHDDCHAMALVAVLREGGQEAGVGVVDGCRTTREVSSGKRLGWLAWWN